MRDGWFWGVAVRRNVVKETVNRGEVVLGGVGLVEEKLADSS
jgi:hypothetical protein